MFEDQLWPRPPGVPVSSLAPGQRMVLGVTQRLVLAVRGPVAERCEVVLSDPQLLPLRESDRGRFVIDTSQKCEQQIFLRGRGESPVTGSVIVEIRVIGGTEQTLDVTNIQLFGDSRTPILQLDIDADGEVQLASIVGSRVVANEGGVREWVHQEPQQASAVCLIDRSASMAWMYLQGALPQLLQGIDEGFADVVGDIEPEYYTYGAVNEGFRWLLPAKSATGEIRSHLRVPDLFSSGALVPAKALAERADDLVIVVSDSPQPFDHPSGNVAFVQPLSAESAGLPQDMQDAVSSCEQFGQQVLVLRAQTGEQMRSEARRWVAEWLRVGLLRGGKIVR